jgi:sodium-coupled monocarboxylate transporter 8/12
LSDSNTPFILKILALVFGCLCIGLAFLADLLGTGVLQASLTIFGVVGGPLLGLFTLGVLCRRVEQKGAVTGFLLGLAVISWVGFGGPKPPTVKLPVSVANCTVPITLPEIEPNSPTEYFYLYRISYAWTCCLGFLVTILIGILVSEVVRLVSGTQKEVEPLLLAKIVRRKGERERDGKQFRFCDTFSDPTIS